MKYDKWLRAIEHSNPGCSIAIASDVGVTDCDPDMLIVTLPNGEMLYSGVKCVGDEIVTVTVLKMSYDEVIRAVAEALLEGRDPKVMPDK